MIFQAQLFLILLSLVAILTTVGLSQAKIIQRPKPDFTAWQPVGTAKGDDPVTFRINLHGENFDALHEKMETIAANRTPWLTSEQLTHYITPSADAEAAVFKFLHSHGITSSMITPTRANGVLTVKSDVATVSKMFNSNFHLFKNARTSQVEPKTLTIHVPDEIAEYVTNIEGINTFHTPRRRSMQFSGGQDSAHLHRGFSKRRHHKHHHKHHHHHHQASSSTHHHPHSSSTATTFTSTHSTSTSSTTMSTTTSSSTAPFSSPTASSAVHEMPPGCQDKNASWPCIARFYGVDTYTPLPYSESVAVINYGLWTDQSLLDFERNLHPEAYGYLPNKAYLGADNGAWNNASVDDTEAILDVQSLLALAYPLNLTVFSSSDDFTQNVQALIDLPDEHRPGVVSISYGSQEEDLTAEDGKLFCNLVQQLTALGTTFLTASGDNGVSVNNEDGCPPFRVDYMSACPYVVSVGATTGFHEERAAYDASKADVANGWSSGGFSNRFPVPDYQKQAVTAYIHSIGSAASTSYNASGRGFTDISAQGDWINTWANGAFAYSGGTSASSPIVASIFGLLNSKCKAAGRSRIGWVHPVLYNHPEVANDITVGGAYQCGTTKLGLPCKAGWDPATGLGSPNFPNLVKAFNC